jgi:hypothetical protein
MSVTNTLAYSDAATNTAIKSFVVQAPEFNVVVANFYGFGKFSLF